MKSILEMGMLSFNLNTFLFKGTADPNVLNQVYLSILNDYFCSKSDWYGDAFIKETTFCAGYRNGGHDSCTV